MQKLHSYSALIDLMESHYAALTDPDAAWSLPMLKGVMSLGNSAPGDDHRHVHMAAKAYLTLSEFQQQFFTTNYEMPAAVRRVLEESPAWPAPLETEGFGEASPADLDAYRAYALSEIEHLSRSLRLAFVTELPGQDMVYLRKEIEAKAYQALEAEPADLSGFPLLAAEVGVTAPGAAELAQLWLQMSAQWQEAAAPLEGNRQTAKLAIEAAETREEITAALDGFRAAA